MTTMSNEWTRSVDERLTRIETRLDGFESRFATKEDLANLKFDLTFRLVALQLIGLGSVAAIVRFLS